MGKHSEVFVGLDVAKAKNAVAIAEAGRNGEVRYLGEIENTTEATRRLIARLSRTYMKMTFCYEAGPTGYGLFRWIGDLGHDCIVVAPSLIPMKASDRVKTNRRDAENLAKLLRAGELTEVWVPDARHEAMRDLVRAREAAAQDQTRKRQQVTGFLLRHGRIYPRKKTWGATHARWLTEQTFDHVEQRIAFEELAMAVRQASERVARLEAAIAELVPKWSMAPLVEALQAMRGIDLVAASILMAELGDLTRFDRPRQLMAFLGLVPSERSTGNSVRRGGITKTGNTRARRVLIESAWSYRLPPKLGTRKRFLVARAPQAVREIAWKAQTRLSARTRALTAKGKRSTVVVAAVARELAGFVWAIGREVAPAGPLTSEPTRTVSCIGGGEATVGELPPRALWPVARSMPAVRQGRPRTNSRSCGIDPRIRA